MSLVRNAAAAAALCAFASAPAAQTPQRTARPAPSAIPRPAAAPADAPVGDAPVRDAPVVGDTLHYEVRAGQPFLVVLPSGVEGRPAAYRVVSAPALSWLVDRSFYWKTLPTERGLMPIVFEQSAASAAPLVLMVEVVE